MVAPGKMCSMKLIYYHDFVVCMKYYEFFNFEGIILFLIDVLNYFI